MALIVSSGATLTLSAGQTSNAVKVLPGGTVDILAGGVATSALVFGNDVVLGGQDSLGTVGSGGTRSVTSGGTVIGGTVSGGGIQTVSAGGAALGATIMPGGYQTVSSGGVASGTGVYGTETVSSGGVVSGSFVGSTTISNSTIFGDEFILGGESISATVGNGGGFTISGLLSSGTGPAGATSAVVAAGIAIGTLVQAGGTADIYQGGVTTGTILLAPAAGFVPGFAGGASDNVFTGGVASGTIVNSGASQGIDGGSTIGTVVRTGGVQDIHSGIALNDDVASGGTVNDSATLALTEDTGTTTPFSGTLSGSGLLIQSGPGTLLLAGALGGFNGSAVISGGVLELTGAASAGTAAVVFALGTVGTLRIDGTAGPANTISSFRNGDTIDLAGLAFSGTATATVSGTSVTITEGGAAETLILAGAPNARFALASDGAGGTQLTDTAPSGIVSAGQVQAVAAGQTSQGVGILAGGELDVLAGGIAVGTTILGAEAILGGLDSASFVSSGGVQTALSGGTVQTGTVGSGGTQAVSGGGTVLSALIGSGGVQIVSSGGVATGTLVATGGLQRVSSGGTASGTLVNGSATVLSGGAVAGSVVSGAGTRGAQVAVETVSGGQSVAAAVGSGGEMIVTGVLSADGATVAASGAASATTVSAGGVLLVGVGGVTSGTMLLGPTPINASGGLETVSGGTADGTVVGSGGRQTLTAGSTSGTRVLSGGSQAISGGTALNDQLLSGGVVTIGGALAFTEAVGTTSTFAGAVYGNGILLQSGPGTLALALTGALGSFLGSAVISGGTLELTSAGALSSAAIAFGPGTADMLRIDGAVGPANIISGLAPGDVIDLAGLRYAGTATPTVSGNTVTVTEGGAYETLTIAGATGDSFALAADDAAGTRLINTAQFPIVSAGETLTVSSGQASNRAEVLAGGTLDVVAGGTAISATLLGAEALPGGTDSLGFVSSGGTQTVSSGGLVLGGMVGSGGVQTISSGGVALGVTVASSGLQTVSAGGIASGTVVHGSATVLSGGIVSGGFLDGSSYNFVAARETILGGKAFGITVDVGGALDVGVVPTYSNRFGSGVGSGATGMADGTTVNAGGGVYIGIGGIATGTVLSAGRTSIGLGATESVEGGAAYGTIVGSGATQSAYIGSASGTVILSGGRQIIDSGTSVTVLNDIVASGGTVSNAGTLTYTEAADVTSTWSGTLVGNGALVQSGPGLLALAGALSGFTGTIAISGGTLELTSAGAAGGAVIGFGLANTGALQIDGTSGPANTISGFAPGDIIDLAGLGFTGTTSPTVSGNTVTVTEGSLTETLLLASAGDGLFRLFPDAAGGTNVAVACYCPGTLILTDRGEQPVETLAIDDRVITVSGAAEPIRWIGRRSYVGRFLAGKAHLLPVRIRAGALGGGLPRRDLLVSPCHAMFIDGLLIPAGQLVNGGSVVQERGGAAVDYVHVELAEHSVIFAEGAPSETYLEDDNRGMFHNAAEFVALYGADAAPGRYCAKRVEDGFALEAVRRRLAGRTAA